jgi:aminoglycoside/choline kinase family phosphotransferase
MTRDAFERAVRAAFGETTRVVSTETLTGDASSRSYVRLRLDGGTAPATVVAMVFGADRTPLGSDEITGDVTPSELPFLNVGRWLAREGFPVPAIHWGDDALLLLEDIGDTTLWAAASAAPARTVELFGAAVDLLVRLQVAGARRPDPRCYAFAQRFEDRLARWEIHHFVEHGIETRRGRALPDAERRAILAALEPLTTPFAAPDLVFVHRDFMPWNLHVQDGRLRLIDFQDALLGPDAYDLAALLADRTTSTLVNAAAEAVLLDRFRAARAAAGMPVEGDLADRYRRCGLQRVLKVVGRFHLLEIVKKKPGYLAYLPPMYAVGRRWLRELPDMADARRLIAPWVPELVGEERAEAP